MQSEDNMIGIYESVVHGYLGIMIEAIDELGVGM